jgi:hypothetical protein
MRLRDQVLATAAFLASVQTASCATSNGQTVAARGKYWIVAADISSSRNATQLRESEDLVNTLSRVAVNGDRITLLRVREHGLADSSFQWTHEIPPLTHPGGPSTADSLDLEDTDRALRAVTPVLFDPDLNGKLRGTDLFGTLFRVADVVRSDRSRMPVLILLSDMLQSTKEVNMERAVPDTSWVVNHAQQHLLPELTGVCVVALGPDVRTIAGQRVLQFWRAYFRATGADFRDANYRNWAPDMRGLAC